MALAFAGDRSVGPSRETLAKLQELVRRELRSDLDNMDASSPKDQSPAETGELGFTDNYDRAALTITFGIAASGFEALDIAADQRPADLIEIPWDQLGDPPAKRESGDLVLQICGDDKLSVKSPPHRSSTNLAQTGRLSYFPQNVDVISQPNLTFSNKTITLDN